MRHLFIFLLFIVLGFSSFSQPVTPQDSTISSVDDRVEWLLQRLTLDEKLSLMVHQNPAIERLGLPAYSWWNEALHGVGRAGEATVYPMPIALAATFDPSMVQETFAHVAREARRKYREAQDTGYYGDYAGLTFFTPNINIFRDPRWGRGMETYGEDPYLTATMGLACVNGLQGGHTAACLKHLAVHSGPEGVRHEFNSVVSDRDLRTTYLPAFEYIVHNSEVAQVMCGYNRLTVRDRQGANTQAGAPCCTNKALFDILRREWGYDGILVTDCWALNDAYETDTVVPRHRSHATAAVAYGDAFGREVDLECGSGLPALKEAVQQGLLSENKVDEHVRRILRVRLAVTDDGQREDSSVESEEGDALRATHLGAVTKNGMVLLKNDGVLPLREGDPLRLEGPNMWDSLMPLGNYNGTPRHTVTIGEALADAGAIGNSEFRILNVENTNSEFNIHNSKLTVVYSGGINPQLEGEELPVEKEGFYKGDRTRIELPSEQVAEIKALKAQGCRVVLVLCAGSAIALENVIDDCDAVLVAWYGGQEMGTAVRQLLYGEDDAFGRLPVTFYQSTDQLPDFESYDMHDRTYRYMTDKPQYPFGYGLSYSHYHLENIAFSEQDSALAVDVVFDSTEAPAAKNHKSVVQVYARNLDDPDGPRKQLVAVAPTWFGSDEVGATHHLTLPIDPFWLRRYDEATGRMTAPESGSRMELLVGFSSDDEDLALLPLTRHDSLPETDSLIVRRIDEWQDLKFGFMMHWGIYAQWGVVESWSICNEPWIVRDKLGADGRPMKGQPGADYIAYKQAYQSLNRTFQPRHFNPDSWADVARRAGMKYVVFTTKHHDGFAMFDTRQSDYSSIGADCPAKCDFTRGVVNAFRDSKMWIGLYFSKPDWHNDDYWAHEWATPDRNVNYDIPSHPDRWQRFCDFTYNQIYELTHNYGRIDILWLDGGWVRPAWSVTPEVEEWLGCYRRIQDVDIPRIAAMAREENPQLLVVDRSVGGKYENYRTPEQQVPDTLLPYPWETCMTLGESWSYSPYDQYKSTKQVIHLLCDIVAKGGNLLLNVGPDADGNLPDTAVQRMLEVGEWLSKNGYAIYATRPLYPYSDGNKRYTQTKDGRHKYEITLKDEYPYAVVKEIEN